MHNPKLVNTCMKSQKVTDPKMKKYLTASKWPHCQLCVSIDLKDRVNNIIQNLNSCSVHHILHIYSAILSLSLRQGQAENKRNIPYEIRLDFFPLILRKSIPISHLKTDGYYHHTSFLPLQAPSHQSNLLNLTICSLDQSLASHCYQFVLEEIYVQLVSTFLRLF